MKTKNIVIFVVGLIIIVVGLGLLTSKKDNTPGKYDEFAMCLGDQGAKFYGAFWCPHCQAQKDLFGKSKTKLPYVECSTPDAKSQLQVCIDQGIESYPTWVFADGSRLNGEIELSVLAEKTSCVLPE